MKSALFVCLVMISSSFSLFAQPELNKRLQKQRAEFEAQIAAEERYGELVELAERSFELDEYADARNYYKEAILFSPDKEAWLTSKINDLDILMAERIALISNSVPRVIAQDSAKDSIISPSVEVDVIDQTEQVAVLESFAENEEIKAVSVVVEIAQTEEKISDTLEDASSVSSLKTLSLNEPKRVNYPEPTDLTADTKSNDYSDYPYGMTEEVFELKNHTIQRIVVVDSLETNVYKRVKHSWGGDFTLKNDLSISQRIWLDELEKYRQKLGY
jgi:hypothetical protein